MRRTQRVFVGVLAGVVLLGPIAAGPLAGWLPAFGVPGSATVMAATPSPTPAGRGDPRSAGEGPGLVGNPGVAILAVIGLGLAAAAVTAGVVRLTGGRRGGRSPGS